jgi:protein-tyrosine phosphatase
MGHAGDGRNLQALNSAGIQAVVDLAESDPPLSLTRDLVYLRFPIADGAGNPPWLLRLAVDAVAGLLRSATPTLVYCRVGMSRTPCVAGAALALIRGRALPERLAEVTASGPADVSPGLWADVQATVATRNSVDL